MLLFLGLDDNAFNEERLTSSLFRFKRGLLALFETYKPAMFEQVKFAKFMSALKQQVLVVQKTLNQRKEILVSLTKDTVHIINRVLRGEKVLEREAENELFKRFSKEIMQSNNNKVKYIEERLYNTVILPQRINSEHERLMWNPPFVQELVKDARLIYDPVYLEMLEQKKREEQESKRRTRKGLLDLAPSKDPDSKSRSIDKRDRVSTRTKFRLHNVMNKSGNYPYTFKNILYNDFYADLVKVELDQAKEEEQDSDMENDLMLAYYEEDYLDRLRTVDRNYAKVTKDDLVEIKEEERVVKVPTNKVTVSYITWSEYPEEQDSIGLAQSPTNAQGASMNMTGKEDEEEEDNHVDGGEEHSSEHNQSKFSMNSVLGRMKAEGISGIRYADQNRNKFNVYQSKHTRDTRGWGIIRSLYSDLKVNRKLSSFLKERTTYYYVNRMGVWKKPTEVT